MLLKAGQGGSGADLCIYLMETYNKGDVKPDAASKARLVTLLRAFPHNEPSKKKFVGGVVEYVPDAETFENEKLPLSFRSSPR
jgi:hypothetical protein